MRQVHVVKFAVRGCILGRTLALAFAFTLLLTQGACSGPQGTGAAGDPPWPATYRGLPLVFIPKLEEPKGAGWANFMWKGAAEVTLLPLVAPIPGAPSADKIGPELMTGALLYSTEKNLYVSFICGEYPGKEIVTNNAETWLNDDVEIFLEAHEDTVLRAYCQISVDAGGKVEFNRRHIYPEYYRTILYREDWKPAIKPQITKTENGWNCVLCIPFSALHLDDQARASQTTWRLNLCRSRPAKEGHGSALSWSWSPLAKVDYQAPARFGFAVVGAYATPGLLARVREQAGMEALSLEDPLPEWTGLEKKLFEPKEFVDSKGRKMMYRFYSLPNPEAGKKYPLVVNFHGSGAEGDDNLKQLDGSGRAIMGSDKMRAEFPCYVALPQWPGGDLRNDAEAKVQIDAEFLPALCKDHPQIDPRRIYVSGGSKGAAEVLRLVSDHPGLVAAALLKSTPGRPNIVRTLNPSMLVQTPMWFYHGDNDPVCKVQEVRDLVETLRKLEGARVKYTEVPGGTHDFLGDDFPPIEIYRWMWAQTRPEK